MDSQPLIQVKNLKKQFNVRGQKLRALDNISLGIYPEETLGLVGESGCGKTVLARSLMRFFLPSDGDILFQGQSMLNLSPKEIRALRHDIQYIFQDPYSSLNPRMSAGDIIAEPLVIHTKMQSAERKERVLELLNLVGLRSTHFHSYPHEFSGGQRQRIGIARALALSPRFIVCDEPIAALDVSIQAQIVNLLRRLQEEMGLTYLFISHDLSMVKYISSRVAVMYLGNLMELAPSEELYHSPKHPYTEALLSAIPIPDVEVETKRTRIFLEGDVPSPIGPPKGCVFCHRCPKKMDICEKVRPEWRETSPGHFIACHLNLN